MRRYVPRMMKKSFGPVPVTGAATLLPVIYCLLASGCDNPARQSGFTSILCTLDTRSVPALGVQADSCLYEAVSGEDTLLFHAPVLSDHTETLLFGVPEGIVEVRTTVFGSDSVVAGGVVQGLSGAGDTTSLDLRVRFESLEDSFLLEAMWGGADTPAPPCSILFVGNSYTMANGGLDSIFTEVVRSAHPDAEIHCEMVSFGGYTLEDHWNNPVTMEAIARGCWDLVILQEQSQRPVIEPGLMYIYAELLGRAVEEAGGCPGFFMTWARKLDPGMITPLSGAYFHAGALTDGMTSPVGLAWDLVITMHPRLELYESDGSHPNLKGTYLTACTMYAAVRNESPVGITYSNDPAMTSEERLWLQEAAWAAVGENGPPDWRHF